jgi:MFS family permease
MKIHFAWVVLSAVMLVMVTASGLRSVFGVFIKPLEADFGWDRASLSGAAAVSLFLLGAVGPLVGRLADRWGPRRILAFSVLLLGVGTVASAFVSTLWHVYLASGILMSAGAGGAGMATASTVAARWFERHRGLVIGLLGGAMSAGQLVVVPLAMALTLSLGWRQSYLWLGLGVIALILPLSLWLVRNDPGERGLSPYGLGQAAPSPGTTPAPPEGRVPLTAAAQVPAFWLLAGTFFVCGYTSSGMVLTHLIPHSMEHGFSEMAAAQALGVMGAMNIVGTVASGWICDRYGRKGPLAFYYFVRGLSLLFLLSVWNLPSLHIFAGVFGLNYISTVPPTTTLTANIFGRYSVGELSGWIFFAHQVGAALGAALGGWVFDWTGSYAWAFLSAALLALAAAGLALLIREEPMRPRPRAVPAPSLGARGA